MVADTARTVLGAQAAFYRLAAALHRRGCRMLCFKFFGDNDSIRIHLCEEAVRYSAYREDGVRLGVSALASLGHNEESYLYAIHRRDLRDIKPLDPPGLAAEPGDFPFPWVFANLVEGRLTNTVDGRYDLRFAGDSNGMFSDAHWNILPLAPTGNESFRVANLLEPTDGMSSNVPFTCLKIGPLPARADTYLIQFSCHVTGSSFSDLVQEDHPSCTRRYKVYGPQQIDREIRAVDLPRSQSFPKIYRNHHQLYAHLQASTHIDPQIYSVVAIDNPNCNPDLLHPMAMSDNLHNLTDLVSPSLCDHVGLRAVRRRVHWFACDQPTRDFYLHLSGPMALENVSTFPQALLARST